MSPSHHPGDELLLALAAGSLAPTAALVVGVHADACPACRAHAARLEAVGGALLDGLPPSTMTADALERALDRLGAPEPASRTPRPQGLDLSEVLAELPLGRRRWLGPGVWMRPIGRDRAGTAYLLRTGPRARLIEHGHAGSEYVLVLKGGFSDVTGRYGVGDFAAADARLTHQPVTDPGEECLCLVFSEAPMRMRGLLGRVLQPLIGL